MYRWVGLAVVVRLCGTATPAVAVTQAVRPPQANDSTIAAPPIALEGVTVIDMVDGRHLADQTVLIVGSRIRAVGERSHVQIPKGVRRVAAQGRYLIPGLWDMHTHNFANPKVPLLGVADMWAMYLTFGITGVRDLLMISPFDSVRQYRRDLAAGRRVGPRVVAGGYITAPGPKSTMTVQATGVDTPEEGRRAVDSLAKVGYDFIKLHSDFSPEVYFAMAAEARKIRIPFAGHPPSALVTAEEIADSGQKSVEHVQYFSTPLLGVCAQSGAEADRACAALGARYVQRGTWLTPTALMSGLAGPNWASLVPDSVNPLASLQTADGTMWFMNRLGRFGFPLLAGTDNFSVSVHDRKSPPQLVHVELALFVEAGLTPLAALQTATLNPAKYLNATDSLGTVEAGKLADLVLLDADPTADIRNITKIRAVVANGHYLDQDALNGLSAEIRTKYAATEKALTRGGTER